MEIALSDVRIQHRLHVKDPVPFVDQVGSWDLQVEAGEVVRVSADSPCLLANLFYVLIGVARPDSGALRLDGEPPAGDLPQARGVGVLDARSALWWDRTLLENLTGAHPDGEGVDEDGARELLDRCGVGNGLAGSASRWRAKARRTKDRDERTRLQAAIADSYSARPSMLPDLLTHKRAELARELAGAPRVLFVLDSCDCAGQPDVAPLYPLLAELAAERDMGVVLFTRQVLVDPLMCAREYRFARDGEAVRLDEVDVGAPPRSEAPVEDEGDVVLELDGLAKAYGKTTVIEGVGFRVQRGQLMVVMGGSGCGKSTLLRMVAGITPTTQGTVHFDPLDEHREPLGMRQICGPGLQPSDDVRKAFGVLFQDGALFNSMTVEQNLSAPILEHTGLHKNVVAGIVEIKLKQVSMWGDDPLNPEHSHKYPSELSGGQRKRIGLARALALDPQVIFYDEPSAGLDPIVSRQIDELMVDLGQVLGVTSIVITHELDSAFAIADRMVVLRKGEERANEYWGPSRMMAQGGREEIMGCVHPHVVEFLHDYSYHHASELARLHNWYVDRFGRGF